MMCASAMQAGFSPVDGKASDGAEAGILSAAAPASSLKASETSPDLRVHVVNQGSGGDDPKASSRLKVHK